MVKKNISGKYVKFFTYLIVIVLINVVGITLFARIDLTENNIYSISKASQNVVSTLSEPLTVKVFFTKNLPAPHNNTERYLHDLLQEYSIYSNQYFNYRFYDVSAEEGDISKKARENQELAKNYGIFPIQIQVVEKDEIKFKRAYMGMVLIHGDIIEKIPTITSVEGLEYRLTTAIQKLNNKISALLSLTEKIHIKLFLSSSLEIVAPYMRLKQFSELPGKIESIVKKMNSKNYGKLEFEHLDPTKDESLQKVSEKYNLLALKWPALSKGKIQPGQGVSGLVMEYGNKAIIIQVIRTIKLPLIGTHYEMVDMNNMEESINKNIESLIDINEDLGYLADHGTLGSTGSSPRGPTGQQDAITNFKTLISQNYTLKNINLKTGTIPESLNCLVIARPKETFSDYELFQIDQFLMRGKNLVVFMDAFNEVMPDNQQGMMLGGNQGPQFIPMNTGLRKLLRHYGIRIKQSFVMDENCYKQVLPKHFGGGERMIYFAPLIKNKHINHDLRFMKNIKGLIAVKISPLELNTKRISENGLKVHRLFASSGKSWEMSERINLNPMFIQPPQSSENQQSLPLAYILEGEFPSYFTGKPIPEKTSAEKDSESKKEDTQEKRIEKPEIDLSKIKGEGEVLSRGKSGKIFIMASSEMLKNNILDKGGKSPNTMFILNIIDFLNNREDIAIMRSKEQRFNPLHDTTAGVKAFIKSFNIVGLPVLVVLFGLLIWFQRHSRMKRIKMIFQK